VEGAMKYEATIHFEVKDEKGGWSAARTREK
jgi:hypothetical protein